MNPWTNQLSAQIVHRMEHTGAEVVESPFEQEWHPGTISQLMIEAWRTLRQLGSQPHSHLAQDERLA